MKDTIAVLLVLVLLLAGAILILEKFSPEKNTIREAITVAEAYYSCNSGKQIKAIIENGTPPPFNPGEMPLPSGRVYLELSDGRKMTLPRTISASGIRYANGDETLIFWSKGEGAVITENNLMTFSGCTQRVWELGNEQADKAVRDKLLATEQLSWKTRTGSTNICIFQNLVPERELFPHYLWVRCSEYMMSDGELTELSGTSVPVKVDYPNELSYFDPEKFSVTIPRDGSLYDKDVKAIFPAEYQERLHFESGPLNELIKKEALRHFDRTN